MFTNLVIVFLLLSVVLLLGWLVYEKRRTKYNWSQFALWSLVVCLTRFWWRMKCVTPLPQAARSGAVIVCNHRSSIDPFFIQVLFKEPTHWMVAKEYCEHWAFRWFLRQCEVIPVSRGGIDTAGTKAAIRYGQEGKIVGMFPEGRINTTKDLLLPVRPGAVLVALRAKTPLLPCFIDGSPFRETPWSPLFIPAKVRVKFGGLIDVSKYADVKKGDELVRELMTQVVRDIAELAGKDDFEPQFAGRKWKP